MVHKVDFLMHRNQKLVFLFLFFFFFINATRTYQC